MNLLGRDIVQIDALVTDRYLDSLLAARDVSPAGQGVPRPAPRRGAWFLSAVRRDPGSERLDRGVRLASERLTRDLPRFHPSFRFEERLAVRLAEAAAAMHLPLAAGGEGGSRAVPFPKSLPSSGDPLDVDDEPAWLGSRPRPLLLGSAVAASALSLAGAAWVAWRRSRPAGSPMARAARAAHAMRGRSTPTMPGRPA